MLNCYDLGLKETFVVLQTPKSLIYYDSRINKVRVRFVIIKQHNERLSKNVKLGRGEGVLGLKTLSDTYID